LHFQGFAVCPKAFCGAEGLNNVMAFLIFKGGQFGRNYGLRIDRRKNSTGLHFPRAVVVIDGIGNVVYGEQVKGISDEPRLPR